MTTKRAAALAAGILAAAASIGGCEQSGEMAILDVQPRFGSTNGEQPVRIIGKNFRQDIGYTIYFGNKKSEQLALRDPETIEVMTPTGMAAGPVDIMIRADNGNAFKVVQAYEFRETQQPGAVSKEDKGNLAF
jgi:hypothetical protein